MKKTKSLKLTIIKTFLAILVSGILLLCLGCRVLAPLQTRVVIETDDGRLIRYVSAKDVTYQVKSINSETGAVDVITEFRSIASEAALAQAERDRIQAEVNMQQSAALKDAVTVIGGGLLKAAN